MSVCLIIHDINLGHLVKVCLPDFSIIRLTFVSLQLRPIGKGEQVLEKRLDQKELT
jgi:hypothetical protein